MGKLGWREYEGTSDNGDRPSDRYARNYFLERVSDFAPEVLDDLFDTVFETFRQSGLALNTELPEWNIIETVDPGEGYLPEVRQKIFEWSRRWNLGEAWCRAAGYLTLALWTVDEDAKEKRRWLFEPVIESALFFRQPKFTFEYEAETEYPREGYRHELEEEIASAFQETLKAYLDRLEVMAGEAGMQKGSKKREMGHFEWLVLYQVKNKSYGEIAKAANATRQTVTEAVKAVASMCGLALRMPKPPGRPRKK